MQLDIFKGEKDKAEARQALTGFADLPAWGYLKRALELNVAYFTEQLRTKKNFKNVEEVSALQDRISDIESFLELPATLLKEAASDLEPEADTDIY
jgi:hypothetical protein